jgi:hypothetical protein
MHSLPNMSNGQQQHVQWRAGPLGFEYPVLIDGGARVHTCVSRQLEYRMLFGLGVRARGINGSLYISGMRITQND